MTGASKETKPKLPPEERARKACFAALERRMRSRYELLVILRRKRIPEEIAERILDRLAEVGLVDDAEFARVFVASRQRSRPRGPRGLAAELRKRGIAPGVIDQVLEEAGESEDPVATARRAVNAKLRALSGKPPDEAKRKAEAFLLRRGFSYDVIRDALADLEDSGEDR